MKGYAESILDEELCLERYSVSGTTTRVYYTIAYNS